MMDAINKVRDFILKRRVAYRGLFMPNGQMTVASETVLNDLRQFCRATSTPAVYSHIAGKIDEKATFIAIGRQEVWHRITQNLHLSDADLYKLVERSQQGTE